MNNTRVTQCGNTEFRWGTRTYVMGIINVTPDSFSGDGITSIADAETRAHWLVDEGADILDIGGQSTRPDYKSISTEEELQRVIPVIERISRSVTIPISIDTMRYEVARYAVDAGAKMINDQWGLIKEPRLAQLAADRKVPIILMSNQREKGGFDAHAGRDTAFYKDVMTEVINFLKDSIETAKKSGVPDENVIIDPGIGFGKTWQQDIEVLRRLSELKVLGLPILIGTSRKSLIKMVLSLPARERVEGTAATVAIGIANGADIVRVHDVKQMVRVCKMADAIVRGV